MMMWQVSPVAFAPTMRLVETTLLVNGALFLNVLMGMSLVSQYGSASRKSCFLLKRPLIVLRRPMSALRRTQGLQTVVRASVRARGAPPRGTVAT